VTARFGVGIIAGKRVRRRNSQELGVEIPAVSRIHNALLKTIQVTSGEQLHAEAERAVRDAGVSDADQGVLDAQAGGVSKLESTGGSSSSASRT
jgi:hypothetical protein